MRQVILQKSTSPKKKYDAIVEVKKVSFSSASYQDYTQHKDDDRKKTYISRHSGTNQNWRDLTPAGAWSKNLLWNKPTITASIKDIEKGLVLI